MTQAGVLTPRSAPGEPRHPRVTPVEFHENGQVARIALEQSVLVPTPVGDVPAELVTFHPSGAVKRVFPANGKLSETWSEEDERTLVPVLRIATAVGEIEARFISICFFPDGNLRSLTLWPDQRVTLETPLGPLQIRQGLAFRPDGSLESVEPARPTLVSTALGPLHAFDPQPIGLNADANSLAFSASGEVIGLATDRDAVIVVLPDGSRRRYEPTTVLRNCTEACVTGSILRLRFEHDRVALRLGAHRECYPRHAVSVATPEDGRRHLPCVD